MNRKRTLILIIILLTGLFPLIPIPMAEATEATVSIQESEDDVWMTESGNIFGYEASVRILEPEIGIRSFLRFGDVPLLKSSKINYATLYVYAGWDQGEQFSPGASVTIYGVDEPDCAPFSYSGRVWSLERPYTSAYVNWNVSDWHQSNWKSVNVTSIVRELINQYAWEQNNAIGFQILGASDSGYEYRTFEDIDHQHHGAYAYLYFQYDTPPGTPQGLPDTAVWEETYGEWDIWSVPGELEPIEYVFTEGTSSPYDINYDTNNGTGPITISTTEVASGTGYGNSRKLIRLENGILYSTYPKELAGKDQIYVKLSIDNGLNWTNATRISNYTGMSGLDQTKPSICVDSNDDIHVVWSGLATGYETSNQIWYSNFNGSWQTPVRISTLTGMDVNHEYTPMIAVDSTNNLYVAWYGYTPDYVAGAIWLNTYNGSWQTPVLISTYDGMGELGNTQFTPQIAVDSVDDLHVAWYGKATGFGLYDQIWYSTYNGSSWGTNIRLSNYTDMENYEQRWNTIAVGLNGYIHVAWCGKASGATAQDQIWYALNNGSWQMPELISDYEGPTYIHEHPSIGTDENNYIHVVWDGKGSEIPDQHIWYANYTDSWSTPECLQPVTRSKWPSLRWANWPQELDDDDTFFLVDENNTVIITWNGENFTDINDLKDWTDDYVDPGGGDPLDPTPGTQGFSEAGPFTRFKMRLYFLVIGLGCIFGPLWAMGYKKLDSVGYAWCALIMILGTGLLWSIVGI